MFVYKIKLKLFGNCMAFQEESSGANLKKVTLKTPQNNALEQFLIKSGWGSYFLSVLPNVI